MWASPTKKHANAEVLLNKPVIMSEPSDSNLPPEPSQSYQNHQKQPNKAPWESLGEGLKKVLTLGKITDKIGGLFNVSESEVAEILERVRAELPTTEALLIGKPQAGKSSIVRGLTGVSAEIVG